MNKFIFIFIIFIIQNVSKCAKILTDNDKQTNSLPGFDIMNMTQKISRSHTNYEDEFKIGFVFNESMDKDAKKDSYKKMLEENRLVDSIEDVPKDFEENYLDFEMSEVEDQNKKHRGAFLMQQADRNDYLSNIKPQLKQEDAKINKEELLKTPLTGISECSVSAQFIIDGPSKEAGRGAFGRVFIPETPSENMVIKEMEVGKQKEQLIRREINISLLFNKTQNVINSYDACFIDRKVEDKLRRFYYLFIEKCEADLGDWFFAELEDGNVIQFEKVVHQIINGFSAIHEKGVLHIDNHIGNYMICDGEIKIIDFGLAVQKAKISPKRLELYENKEFNELHSLLRSLFAYKQIKDKVLGRLIEGLQRLPKRKPKYFSIDHFKNDFDKRYFETKDMISQGRYDENSVMRVSLVSMLMVFSVWFSFF